MGMMGGGDGTYGGDGPEMMGPDRDDGARWG